jgi:hypothetical protein
MNGRMTVNLTLILYGGVILLGFIFWILGVFAFWALLNFLGIQATFWVMLEALSTAVAAAAVLGVGIIAHNELNEAARGRYLTVADRLFDELNSPENIAARRRVFTNLPENPQEGVHSISSEDRAAMKSVLNSLDRVAFLTQAGWIPDELVMPWMNPMVVKSWEKLAPYVAYESQRRHEPDYYQQVRVLAERCLAWRSRQLKDARITWVEDAI